MRNNPSPVDGGGALSPPLREVIARFGLAPRKRLGQHFLLDGNLAARIVRCAGDLKGVTVVEIGPGPGGLTRALLAAGAERIVAVERDRRCIAALADLADAQPGRLRVIEGDALKIDIDHALSGPVKIVANLPYNIATTLLLKWLADPQRWLSLTLMFQKEVAHRITAQPANKSYGRLSVLIQWLCETQRFFDISPSAFVPPPRVTSTLVGLKPRAQPLAPANRTSLERVLAVAFGQRRKMLRSSLKGLGVEPGALLAAAGIAGTARAEDLDVTAFCGLARALAAFSD